MDISGSSRVGDLVGGKKAKTGRQAFNSASRRREYEDFADKLSRGKRDEAAGRMRKRAEGINAEGMASAASRVFAHQPVAKED